jgi:hypothetical protein
MNANETQCHFAYQSMVVNRSLLLPTEGVNGDPKEIVKIAQKPAHLGRSIMSETRVVSLDGLLKRLEEVLGQDSLLLHRFEAGLRHEDEQHLTDAIRSLRLYPDPVRRLVEDTVMGWLFGAREEEIAGLDQAKSGR